MYLLDYDDFNIYTTSEDVKEYVNSLIIEGYEFSEEIYTMCIEHFGDGIKSLLNEIFFYED
jgi:hypothetical protein